VTKKGKIWLIVAIVAVVLACCCVVSAVAFSSLGSVFNMGNLVDVAERPGSPRVNLASYERVEVGMTYREVESIFGGPGVLAAQLELAGKRLEFYAWKGLGEGQVIVTFKDGMVMDKTENNLQ
jgi:hypothetical protein